MTLLAEAARWLGDPDELRAVYRRLLPYDDRVAVSYPEVSTGAVARYLGLLAASLRPARKTRCGISRTRSPSTGGSAPARGSRAPDTTWHASCSWTERIVSAPRSCSASALTTYRELGMTGHAADASALARESDAAA